MLYRTSTTGRIIRILKQAGRQLKALYQASTHIEEKSPKDYVTSADLVLDTFLKQSLARIFPGLSVYSEEANSESLQPHQWVIDPIDGTANFILGIPHVAISLAYLEEGQVLAAFVYNPLTQELFWTDPWHAAMLNSTPISVSTRTEPNSMYGLFGFSANYTSITRYHTEWSKLFTNSKKALGVLSPSLSICAVARGKADFFIDFGCSPEGKVAAAEILRRAGGKLYNYDTTPYTIASTGIVASNGGQICC